MISHDQLHVHALCMHLVYSLAVIEPMEMVSSSSNSASNDDNDEPLFSKKLKLLEVPSEKTDMTMVLYTGLSNRSWWVQSCFCSSITVCGLPFLKDNDGFLAVLLASLC